METEKAAFLQGWAHIEGEVYTTAVEKGWWNENRNDGECIALIHSELSEALEALRTDPKQSEKIPNYKEVEEELADVVIRIMDLSMRRGWLVAGAILDKVAYNKTRPVRHGGKKF